MRSSLSVPVSIGIVLVILFSCLCLCLVAVLGYLFFYPTQTGTNPIGELLGQNTPTSTPHVLRPTPRATATTPGATSPLAIPNQPGSHPTQMSGSTLPGESNALANAVIPTDTLATLENSVVPTNNMRDLAQRLEGIENIPATLTPPAVPFLVGAQQSFWVSNTDTKETFRVQGILRYITPHLYFWVEEGISYNENDLSRLADTFENKIYPTDREFFGSEWTPGIDGDPHLYILYARGLGSSLAGYFSSLDEYPPQVYKYSNAHEMFLVNADNVSLGDEFTYGVLAHEFQHMIQWNSDRNETSWMNEGFSELAAFLNGYDMGGFETLYLSNPDVQLNDWPNDRQATSPHYGASFLFLDYFLNRFGEKVTKELVADPENGLESIDDVLKNNHATDSLAGKPIRADNLFADWTVATYLQDASVADGRYSYSNYPDMVKPGPTETINTCPVGPLTRDVHQYGVDYIAITCPGDYNLHFEGSTMVKLLPEDPHSLPYAFWSNKGDESDMTLTRSFDFTNHSGPLTFSFWTWYDLEKNYDFVYLEASLDGENWKILTTPSGTSENPTGNNYGWGYNGLSGGGPKWIQEKVDLSAYDGKKVQIRFEYVTDTAINGEGFLLDDVSVSEIGYSTSFDKDAGGWIPNGFVRIENVLPQTYSLELITKGKTTTVQDIPVSENVTADIPLHIGGDVKEVVLVVSGTTRFTRQMTGYLFSIK